MWKGTTRWNLLNSFRIGLKILSKSTAHYLKTSKSLKVFQFDFFFKEQVSIIDPGVQKNPPYVNWLISYKLIHS